MRLIDDRLRLSASDLVRFGACRHATSLDLRLLEIGDVTPAVDGDEAELLRRQGAAHEETRLDAARRRCPDVVEVPTSGPAARRAASSTIEAMRAGVGLIYQAELQGGAWGGRPDFLERVDRPSALGGWSYEVVDAKLRRRADPGHALQLALYSDMLAEAQGLLPVSAHLELGGGDRVTISVADVSAYARRARRSLEHFVAERPPTRARPTKACTLCRWRTLCGSEWERADDLSLAAGITRSQRERLEAAGITTLTALSATTRRVPGMVEATRERLRVQAMLQVSRRAGGSPAFRLRDLETGRGFDLMPRPDDGDLFYDIEGDPYHEGGLEYLHGVWYRDAGEWTFRAFWAHDRAEEGRAAAALIGFLVERLRDRPEAHVYHYANYEIAALRRLTAAHGVAEAAMDQLLRERRFVDLFKVVSGAIIASEKGYSIKNLEAFYMEKRDGDVATAGASVVFYEKWRETGDDTLLERIHDYNRIDCVSTQLLRDWLVAEVRPAALPWPDRPASPADRSLADAGAEDAAVVALRARLAPVADRLGRATADLLRDLVGFHAREDRPAWWAIFDGLSRDDGDLRDDLDCVEGLEAVGPPVSVTARSTERTYAFPIQETRLRAGDRPCIRPAETPEDVDLREIDREAGVLVLRRSTRKGPLPDRLDLLPAKPIDNRTLRAAILAAVDDLVQAAPRTRAVEHLLSRLPPVFVDGPRPGGVLRGDGDLPRRTSAAVMAMDRTTLAIQGPPGTGKTYVSALAIVDLVRAGRRVAVSSGTHDAIGNLLEAVARRAAEVGVPCAVVRKVSGDRPPRPGIVDVSDNDAPEIARADVVGATAWHFARYAKASFDHLFVDEAGQVSLANVVAMSRAAGNLVLVGDPMQLPQPLKGSHPEASARSCLEHLVGDGRVVSPARGVFMPVSRRMHPAVCSFVSSAVYEGRLGSDEASGRQDLRDARGRSLVGAGVREVAHRGRSQTCPEEVEAVRRHLEELLGATWRDRDGGERPLQASDVLVVAPYNAQVNALRSALPAEVRVGTVDRFQGQEAPVCLISMTTSGVEELPRDIGFLFSPNRINVAVSRAQARAVVFASPRLLDIPCGTIDEMRLVNALCLLREVGGDGF